MTSTTETVNERIKRIREARGMSQRQLADGCERVSYAYISRVEASARRPSVRAIRELARELGVTAHYLEFGEDDPIVKKLRGLASTLQDVLMRFRGNFDDGDSIRAVIRTLEREANKRTSKPPQD